MEKTPEEILRQYYQKESYYVKEACEMRGIELYSIEMAVKAMKEFAEQEVAKVIVSTNLVIVGCQHEFLFPTTFTGSNPERRCWKCGQMEGAISFKS